MGDIFIAICTGHVSEFITKYDYMLWDNPEKDVAVALYLNRALGKLSLGLAKHAVEDCQTVIAIDPNCTLAYFFCGIAHLWNGSDKDALSVWRAGISQGGQFYHFVMMTSLINNHNFRTYLYSFRYNVKDIMLMCQKGFSTEIYTNSDSVLAYQDLNDSHFAKALAQFDKIIGMTPKNYKALIGRGVARAFIGHWSKAIEDIQAGLEGEPDNNEAYLFLGAAHQGMDNIQAAIHYYTHYLCFYPDNTFVIRERAVLHAQSGHHNLAIHDFQRIPQTSLMPYHWAIYAECFYNIGKLEIALEMVDNADPDVILRAGVLRHRIYRDLGRLQQARTQIEHSYRTGETYEVAYEAANFYYKSGLPDLAVQVYTDVFRFVVTDSKAFIQYLNALLQLLQFQEATQSIKKYIDKITTTENSGFDYLLFDEPQTITPYRRLPNETRDRVFNVATLITAIEEGADLSYILLSPGGLDTTLSYIFHNTKVIPRTKPFVFEESPEILKMVEDADRLGQKCIPSTSKRVFNRRVVRALGLAVLYLTRVFDELFEGRKDHTFGDILTDLSNIMVLADTEESLYYTPLCSTNMPNFACRRAFMLVEGEYVNPRYSGAIPAFVEKMKAALYESGDLIIENSSIFSPDDLACVAQREIITMSPYRSPGNSYTVASTLVFQPLDVNGYNMFITGPQTKSMYQESIQALEEEWEANFIMNVPTTDNLACLVLLFFISQPLTLYNNELAWAFYHAYQLCVSDVEVGSIPESDVEMAISHMIRPDPQKIIDFMYKHEQETSCKRLVTDDSIRLTHELRDPMFILSLLKIDRELIK